MIKSQLHCAKTKIHDGDRYLLDVTKISKVMKTFRSIQRHTTTNVNLYWVLGNEYAEDGTKAAMTYIVANAYTILTIRHLDFSFIWIFSSLFSRNNLFNFESFYIKFVSRTDTSQKKCLLLL